MRRLLFHLSRLTLGLLFLYAGGTKVVDLDGFAGTIASYQLFPYAWNYLVAAILPFIELLAGALLLFNAQVRPASLVLGLLNLIFIVALVSLIWRGLEIDCGCFGSSGRATTPQEALVRDLVLMVLIFLTYRWMPGQRLRSRTF